MQFGCCTMNRMKIGSVNIMMTREIRSGVEQPLLVLEGYGGGTERGLQGKWYYSPTEDSRTESGSLQ